MGNNRFMVVSEEKDIIAMNPSYHLHTRNVQTA